MNDLISRRQAIDAICEDGTQLERQGQYSMTMAERKQRDTDILDALPSAQPQDIAQDIARIIENEKDMRVIAKNAQTMQVGWVCPVCGRGLSPLTMVCPCQNGKGWKITCKI